MNKCFITKLPSSVDNDNLPVLGQLRINWLKQDALSSNSQRGLWLSTNNSITVKVSGAHFTDETLTSNLGNTKTITASDGLVALYVSNDADAILTIDNKYSLTALKTSAIFESPSDHSISLDIDDIRYCTNLTSLVLQSPQVTGDVDAVSKLTNLTSLNLSKTKVNGDIKAISGLTKLFRLSLNGTKITGDISAISGLTKLAYINLTGLPLSGTVDSFANLTELTDLTLIKGSSLTGDMSKIPANVNFISMVNRGVTTNFTWTARGRQNATLLAIEGGVPFDTTSMDNMLIDQATCTFKPNASQSWTKIIAVRGTRTSASDAAVAAIQSKGVTITGVTKQA